MDTGKLAVKFLRRDSAEGPQKIEEISGADCVIFAVGRNPCTGNLGLDKLVLLSMTIYFLYLARFKDRMLFTV